MTNNNGFFKISHYFLTCILLVGPAGTDSINRALGAHVQEPKSCDHAVTASTQSQRALERSLATCFLQMSESASIV